MTKNISIADLQVLLAAGGVNLVDVREADEYASGHVPGATNLPLSDFLERYGELDKEKSYHIICQSGARSAQACAFLNGEGYDVTNVAGGTIAWLGDLE